MEKKETSIYIYNPYILLLCYLKIVYLDKILDIYLNPLYRLIKRNEEEEEESKNSNRGKLSYNFIEQLVIDDYFKKIIIKDIKELEIQNKISLFKLDIYFCNFEYFIYRMIHLFSISKDDLSSSLSFFKKELEIIQNRKFKVEDVLNKLIEKKGGDSKIYLKKRLKFSIDLYINDIYLNKYFNEHKRRERVKLLFNLKESIEKDIKLEWQSENQRKCIYFNYDKESISYLIYLYFINEFIYYYKDSLFHQYDTHENLLKTLNIKSIESKNDVLFNDNGINDDEFIIFLESIRTDIIKSCISYINGFCIDFHSKEEEEEEEIKKDNKRSKYKKKENEIDYNKSLISSYNDKYKEKLNIKSNEISDNDIYHILKGKRNNQFKYLNLLNNEIYYENFITRILFDLKLEKIHLCDYYLYHTDYITTSNDNSNNSNEKGGIPPEREEEGRLNINNRRRCHLCRYINYYKSIFDFYESSSKYNYLLNTNIHPTKEAKDKIQFNLILKYTIIELIEPFQGYIFNILYIIFLIFYNDNEIITNQFRSKFIKKEEEHQYNIKKIFNMIDINLIFRNIKEHEFILNIDKKYQTIYQLCFKTFNNNKDEKVKYINNDITYKLLNSIELSILIINQIQLQQNEIEKYERNNNTSFSINQKYELHSMIMNELKLLYSFFFKILYREIKKLQ